MLDWILIAIFVAAAFVYIAYLVGRFIRRASKSSSAGSSARASLTVDGKRLKR